MNRPQPKCKKILKFYQATADTLECEDRVIEEAETNVH